MEKVDGFHLTVAYSKACVREVPPLPLPPAAFHYWTVLKLYILGTGNHVI